MKQFLTVKYNSLYKREKFGSSIHPIDFVCFGSIKLYINVIVGHRAAVFKARGVDEGKMVPTRSHQYTILLCLKKIR
jgi:hypothetical protein